VLCCCLLRTVTAAVRQFLTDGWVSTCFICSVSLTWKSEIQLLEAWRCISNCSQHSMSHCAVAFNTTSVVSRLRHQHPLT
jgi:hypothetical protein